MDSHALDRLEFGRVTAAMAVHTESEAGHEVRVFCLAGDGLPAEGERDGYTFRRVEPPAWISWTGPRRIVPLLRWFSRFEFLARAAEAWRPDVVHGHDLEMLGPAGRLAERLGVPLVVDDHEAGGRAQLRPLEDRLDRDALEVHVVGDLPRPASGVVKGRVVAVDEDENLATRGARHLCPQLQRADTLGELRMQPGRRPNSSCRISFSGLNFFWSTA